MLSQTYWNERYLKHDTGWDLGEISRPLKEYFDQLTNRKLRILIPGCGNAYEAEYLFKLGFEHVYLIDLSQEALNAFQTRNPEFPKDQLICGNFFQHHEKYDLMVEQTFFCAIDPKLRADYVKHASTLLNPGGKLIGLLFDDPLNTEHPPFGGSKTEYEELFEPYFELNTLEKAYNSIGPRQNRELFIKLINKAC
ncbi:MAG: methyltransferase domain-containing protein [Flavobacteriales bacterium]|nr:methyltransferase domain-containing protein [Flavobacteriales bacterium]